MAEMGRTKTASRRRSPRRTLSCAGFAAIVVCLLVDTAESEQAQPSTNTNVAETLLLRICVALPLQTSTGVTDPFAVSEGVALATAAQHIVERNFTLIPDGAALLADRAISLEFVTINLPSLSEAYHMPVAIKTCCELGGHYLLGIPMAAHAEAGSLMTNYYGIPLSSSTVVSPRLSDEEKYPLFHRLVASAADMIPAAIRFIRRMKWQKVAIVYNRANNFGEIMRSLVQAALAEEGLDYMSFAFPVANSVKSYSTQLQALVNSDTEVVLDCLTVTGLLTLGAAMDTLGPGVNSLPWLRTNGNVDLLNVFGYPRSKVSTLLQRTLPGWLQITEPHHDRASLKEAMMHVDLEHFFGNVTDPAGDPVDFSPSVYDAALEPMESRALLRAYDSVWVAVSALAKASEALAGSWSPAAVGDPTQEYRKALGAEAHRQITSGMVSFSGLSGEISFKPNGDRNMDLETEELVLVNYVLDGDDSMGGAPTLREQCSGVFRNGEWVLQTDANGTWSPVVWPDGGIYPYVPKQDISVPGFTGSDAMALSLSLVIVALLVVLVIATALLCRHNKGLRERLKSMQQDASLPGLDMDTPVARMVRFLRQYQHSVTHFSKKAPTVSEAAALEMLIISHADRLSAPDLQGQLASKSNHFSDEVYNFVLKECTGRSTDLLMRSRSLGNKSARSVSTSASSVFLRDASLRDLSLSNDKTWRPQCSPEVKARLESADFFLDAITDESPLRDCPNPLAAVVESALESLSLMPNGAISATSLIVCMKEIEAGYLTEGYHCCNHAADVTNRVVSLLSSTGIAMACHSTVHRVTMLATIFGAAVHDYKHPQVSNGFLVEEGSDLALSVNDYAVLEMHSLRSAFELLASNPSFDFMKNWNKAHRKLFRKTVIQIVLATDMSSHFDLIGQFSTQIGQNKDLQGMTGGEKWKEMCPRDRLLTLQVAMKVADLGHCYTHLGQHREWVQRLEEEFFKQGDLEKAAGREPGPLMERSLPGASSPSSSIGFFRVIALPLISAWVEVFPECKYILKQAQKNFSWWQGLVSSTNIKLGDSDNQDEAASTSTASSTTRSISARSNSFSWPSKKRIKKPSEKHTRKNPLTLSNPGNRTHRSPGTPTCMDKVARSHKSASSLKSDVMVDIPDDVEDDQ